jgi:hypothetical protein
VERRGEMKFIILWVEGDDDGDFPGFSAAVVGSKNRFTAAGEDFRLNLVDDSAERMMGNA